MDENKAKHMHPGAFRSCLTRLLIKFWTGGMTSC